MIANAVGVLQLSMQSKCAKKFESWHMHIHHDQQPTPLHRATTTTRNYKYHHIQTCSINCSTSLTHKYKYAIIIASHCSACLTHIYKWGIDVVCSTCVWYWQDNTRWVICSKIYNIICKQSNWNAITWCVNNPNACHLIICAIGKANISCNL